MKMKSLLSLVCLVVIGLTACQKELSQENGGGGAVAGLTGDFRAKIDGVQWVANQSSGAIRNGGYIMINGQSTDGKVLVIQVVDSGVHAYTLDEFGDNGAAYVLTPNGSSFGFTSNASGDTSLAGGKVSITSIDTTNKKMSGTFKFRVLRDIDTVSHAFTEGSFTNISYTTSNGIPPGNPTDTFRVKLNGVDWVNYNATGIYTNLLGQTNISIISSYDANTDKNIGLDMSGTIVPGSYSFSAIPFPGDPSALYDNGATPDTSYSADGGNLTILEHNTTTKRIRGTFNFIATPVSGGGTPITFTAGYFSVKYQ
ncbi:MAG: hypothetical protein JWQ27_2596 [Ferruginibacter sp.]|nr:hypothetical protein [Ferruginibacter sp.]